MRLWSLDPSLLDRQGLTACWREGLLAQAVLAGRTRGYRHHPQLDRFRSGEDPLALVGAYLCGIQQEATDRGYHYDASRIDRPGPVTARLAVTTGQLDFELAHLRAKVARRSPDRLADLPTSDPPAHPLFRVEPGPVAAWERP